ncbi:MAG: HAD-IB family phosphatase [Planctomycetota bacterium]|nr:HAD-IB family phosphatase [Planctomycetota bacterium]MEC9047161.1 HAD-IB family phosphatase [Planctomycetota bacterium]
MESPPFAAVYFDCDSTLSSIEGVDELLRFADPELRREVVALTDEAMNGTRPLAEVYEARLGKLAPRRDLLEEVGAHYVANIVPDGAETIAALQHLGKHVGVVSGGLLVPVQGLARHLGIPLEHVHAVPLLFDEDGNYRDFDRESPLWRNGGKVPVVRGAPADHHPMAFVGDGITDLETKDHVARFVGFGGVIARDAVRAGADHYASRRSLSAILPLVLTDQELAALANEARFAPLLSGANG